MKITVVCANCGIVYSYDKNILNPKCPVCGGEGVIKIFNEVPINKPDKS